MITYKTYDQHRFYKTRYDNVSDLDKQLEYESKVIILPIYGAIDREDGKKEIVSCWQGGDFLSFTDRQY